MSFLNHFRSQKKSAQVAKERLQIIVARERGQRGGPDYLPRLKQELVNVVRKYVPVVQDGVKIRLEQDGDLEVLEINVTLLPERGG